MLNMHVVLVWEGLLPVLFVLKPEAVPISDTLKLVQDDGGENWTWTIDRLQQTSREQFQFRDVSIIQLCNISE